MVEVIRLLKKRCLQFGLVFYIIFALTYCHRIELVNKAELTLITNWDDRLSGVSIPDSYILEIGDRKITLSGTSNALPDLLPGSYRANLYNEASGISVKNGIATVSQLNEVVDNMPGWFFSGSTNVTYTDNEVDVINLQLRQQVRELQISLRPTGGNADKIQHIKAKMTGVAGAWNIIENMPSGNGMEVVLPFEKQTDGSWLAVVRLMGIIGSDQTIVGQVSFMDGLPNDLLLSKDIGASLSLFNTDKHKIMSFSGLLETPTEVGYNASIIDWKQVEVTGIAW